MGVDATADEGHREAGQRVHYPEVDLSKYLL
jgi:hypothetical protein